MKKIVLAIMMVGVCLMNTGCLIQQLNDITSPFKEERWEETTAHTINGRTQVEGERPGEPKYINGIVDQNQDGRILLKVRSDRVILDYRDN